MVGLGNIGIGNRGVLAIKMFYAAQIALALLTDIGDEQQRQRGEDSGCLESGGQGPESGQSGTVVTDTGTEEQGLVAADMERS